MDHSRKCMSIHAIVDNNNTPSYQQQQQQQDVPLSPPDSFKSRSPSLSSRMNYMSFNNNERGNSFKLPMSVEERRYRNKLASAKYRAKKQASMKTVTTKVSQLMTSNNNLQRELSKVKQENEVLRVMLLSQQQQRPSTPPQQQQHYHQQSLSSYQQQQS